MPDFNVIADVGSSLLKLLREQLVPNLIAQPEQIALASPAERGDIHLGLFLYNVIETGTVRETRMVARGPNSQQFPPMTLNLHYLLTVYSHADVINRAEEEARILGRAMQVLYDNSVLRAPYLEGSLAEREQEFRIVVDNLSAHDLSEIWTFRDVPYKLSVGYIVGPVQLDSTRVRAVKKVIERDVSIHG